MNCHRWVALLSGFPLLKIWENSCGTKQYSIFLFSVLLSYLPISTVTNAHKSSGLKQYILILPELLCSEVQSKAHWASFQMFLGLAPLGPARGGEAVFFSFLASSGCLHPSTVAPPPSRCSSPLPTVSRNLDGHQILSSHYGVSGNFSEGLHG